MIEKNFDISFIADLALREKQVQQNFRPIIAVHKWFARRPGTLFRGLLLSEFGDYPITEAFYQSNTMQGIRVADPFMGGGTPLIEANRMGCDVLGIDINPMSYWIVKQEIEHLDLNAYVQAAHSLRKQLETQIGQLYLTRCVRCGSKSAQVKYFIWVKVLQCSKCGENVDLFPGYLLAGDTRHPKNVFICPTCGELTEAENRHKPGACNQCGEALALDGPAKRNCCECRQCKTINNFPVKELGPPQHRLVAIEYYCHACKGSHKGRFFKVPDTTDLSHVQQAGEKWAKIQARFVPDDTIPPGDETNRLHRWGYTQYRQMFNSRQLLGLELSAQIIAGITPERVRNALATNLSDLLRYQNMLCRYDTMALKSLDIFSIHGFPVGLIQCESNLLGIMGPDKKICVGSGGWANIVEKFRKAKLYCDHPFEVLYHDGKKQIVPIEKEWIGDYPNGNHKSELRKVELRCGDAAMVEIQPGSIDAILTDPPYFSNVQYAELMDFCYVWLRRLVDSETSAFENRTTRNTEELTGNQEMGRGLEHFTEGLSKVFQRMAVALKPGGPLAFTYHHNDLTAYYPIAIAILDAGLTCSASLPCPAEMGASIHINGTGSSIIDTVFVCRTTGSTARKSVVDSTAGVVELVQADLAKLRAGNVKPSAGDKRCIVHGHLIRLAIWNLRQGWNRTSTTPKRLATVSGWLQKFGSWKQIEPYLVDNDDPFCEDALFAVRDNIDIYGAVNDEIPF